MALKGTLPAYKGIESLRDNQVIWLWDFNLDKYIKVPMKFKEIEYISHAFPMLVAKRADYFIGAESDFQAAMKDNKIEIAKYSMDFVIHLNLYLAFADTPRGKRFKELWDKRMEALKNSPEFKAGNQRYGFPVPYD